MDTQNPTSKSRTIKSLYFYVVSFVALMMVVWATANLINIALKTWVFTKADEYTYRVACPTMPYYNDKGIEISDPAIKEQRIKDCEKQEEINRENEKQNKVSRMQADIVRDISMIVVGLPLFFIHWRIVRSKEENL